MKHRIRYLSDLHLEFIRPNSIETFIKNIPPGLNETCILAGDIGDPHQPNYDAFMQFTSKNFKKSFVISGNHEYYNKTKTIQETNKFMKDYFQQFHNIHFLNNSYEMYDGYCFIGTTLWSKITNPEFKINDVYKIPHFDYIKYNRLNALSVEFLEDTLQNKENCVIISHHVPSNSLIDIKYKTQRVLPYNQWFYCDMGNLIEANKDKIKCWVYGHTHTPSSKIINGIPFLCNPVGYPNENATVNFQTTFKI
jgi:predicted MPP superfamily phosphohydrolase